jgi:pyrimidine operon attenuation protein/uracil phosphoribosyltransferase
MPDVKLLLGQLAEQIRPAVTDNTALVGVHTGGVWLAERLHTLLGVTLPLGSIDVAFYRDDYGMRGLHPHPQKSGVPFEVTGRHIILVDDVLYTGRTTRAALNEIFDYGRPARVDLAVLVDRGERQLPIAARFCAHTLTEPLNPASRLSLQRDAHGNLALEITNHA